jgi:serine/threonine protein kinase
MFRKDGAVVLVDFGIVKAVNEKTKLTRTGISVGTPQYMSPEQIKARKVDGRSDIYSLGIVLYELLTGKLPYQADDLVKLALQHTGDPIPKLPEKLKDFQPLIEKMLSKNPHERVRNAEGLIRLIDALDFKFKEKTTKIQRAPSKRRRKAPLIIFLIIIIAVAIGAGYLVLEKKRQQELTAWETAESTDTIKSYQVFLNRYPTGKYKLEALVNLAQKYVKRGNFKEAREKLEEAKRIKVTPEIKTLEQKIIKKIGKN